MKLRFLLITVVLAGFSFSCKPKDPVYVIETTLGTIKVKLYEKTPLHKENFEKLVSENYYDGVQFHRVIQNFMIQTGNGDTKDLEPGVYSTTGNGGPLYTVAPEFVSEYYHKKGALAAARKGDQVNPAKRSSGSQFYIVQGRTYTEQELGDIEFNRGLKYTEDQRETYKTLGGTPFLDLGYTVFGEVTEGLEVVDKIAAVSTGAGDWPVEQVKIIRIVRE